MTVLLMRLAAPMQSWGTRSRFSVRDTEREPSKSGVIGLIAAALGRKRSEPLNDLAALKMGVRVNREGDLLRDFHTVGGGKVPGLKKYGVAKAGSTAIDTVISTRYYLSDADFLVGLEGDKNLLEKIHSALAAPVFPIFLGRKSFVPSIPVFIPKNEEEDKNGLSEKPLESALRKFPFFIRPLGHLRLLGPFTSSLDSKIIDKLIPDRIRLILETDFGKGEELRMDNPECFEVHDRRYAPRYITTKYIPKADLHFEKEEI